MAEIDQVERFKQLQETVRLQENKVERLRGQREQIDKTIQSEFGISPKEAKALLKKTQRELTRLEQELKDMLDKVEEQLSGITFET